MKKLLIILTFITTVVFAENKPNFSIIDTNNITHTTQSTNGKYLILNFWATWCPPCIKEFPELVDFYENNKDKIEIIGMNYEDSSPDKITNFADGFMVEFPIVLVKNQRKEFEKFDIKYLPTTYIYNKKGKLLQIYSGEITSKILSNIIKP